MISNNTLLSIIIVNWNVKYLLSNCLNSIKEYLSDIDYEVIVIDNASTDSSAQILKERYPWIRLIENKENQGFARANNQGFKMAKGKYILILNPDTIIKKNSIQKMIKRLESDPEIGIVGPRIVNEDGKIAPTCKRSGINLIDLFLKKFLFKKMTFFMIDHITFLKKVYYRRFYRSEPTPCIEGACMLVRKNDLDVVGYFDENIPMYLDDRDLCYRFRQKGFKVFYCADAEIIHICGASTKKAEKSKLFDILASQAVDTFFTKHANYIYVFVHRIILLFSSIWLLFIDVIIFPVVVLIAHKYMLSVIVKHLYTVQYSITGKIAILNFKNYKNKCNYLN